MKVPPGRKKTSAVPDGTLGVHAQQPSLERLGYGQPNQKQARQNFAPRYISAMNRMGNKPTWPT